MYWKEKIQQEGTQEIVDDATSTLVDVCHSLAKEAGWWPDEVIPQSEICTKLLLIITEVCEATEGLRKNLMDDKLPHRKMFEVELADAAIRIFDLAGATGIVLGGVIAEKLAYNATREDHTPEHRAGENGKKF